MYDRFRELEKPHAMRKRDVVLMATVTSFETLQQPTRSDLRQFAELFRPLYENSSELARRQAVAALSQCTTLPETVCYFIGSQPITIAAIFLSRSKAISDQTLIDIARSQGEAHAKAIAGRDELSPGVVDALAALHDGYSYRKTAAAQLSQKDTDAKARDQLSSEQAFSDEGSSAATLKNDDMALPLHNAREIARLTREEALRNDLRHLVSINDPDRPVPKILSGIDAGDEALLVRFARSRQVSLFSRTLAHALGSSIWLSERILMDVSGAQLATTMVAFGMNGRDMRFILCHIYPHLAISVEGRSRAHILLRSLDPARCVERVAAWRRADHYTATDDAETAPTAGNQDTPLGKPTRTLAAGERVPLRARTSPRR